MIYKGKRVNWSVGAGGWHVIKQGGLYLAEVNVDGHWYAYDGSGRYDGSGTVGRGHADSLGAAKSAAEKALLDAGVITTAPAKKPAAETYVFNYRADRGGATAAVVVSRLPEETVVVYGVAFCAPSDEYDKETGAKLAAYRLVAEPSSLSLPVGVQPKDIKAAIFQACVIPDGNHLRSI